MFKAASHCRLCGKKELTPIIDLGNQYLTGIFPRHTGEVVDQAPLQLVKCTADNGCGLVQLQHTYDLGKMYGDNYGYRSGLNASMVKHLASKVEAILKQVNLQPGDIVIDVGSNDATTLKHYPQNGLRLIGVDPTGEKFKSYYPDHVNLIADFFPCPALNKSIGPGKAKVVTSFSCFYDLEAPLDFAKAVADILDDDGIWVCEQSYMPLMLEKNSYDTICHEHLEYYGLAQFEWIAKAAGLKIIDVTFNAINGGSFSVDLAKVTSPRPAQTDKINKILADEKALESMSPFAAFAKRAEEIATNLRTTIERFNAEGKTVYGIGASTKGNVILQYAGLTPEHIKAIGEVNDDKFGSVTPGSHIPIISEADVLRANPDYLLVLPWHFLDFFKTLKSLKGRKLLMPLPSVSVIEV